MWWDEQGLLRRGLRGRHRVREGRMSRRDLRLQPPQHQGLHGEGGSKAPVLSRRLRIQGKENTHVMGEAPVPVQPDRQRRASPARKSHCRVHQEKIFLKKLLYFWPIRKDGLLTPPRWRVKT